MPDHRCERGRANCGIMQQCSGYDIESSSALTSFRSSVSKPSAAASAIAAFQLSRFCFSALVQNGIVPKPDAERVLRQAVQTNKTGGPGNQAAADLLAIFLDQVTKFQPPTRQ